MNVSRNRFLSLKRAITAVGAVAAMIVAGATSSGANTPAPTSGTVNGFGFGQLSTKAVGHHGCGTNSAGEPSIHVSKDDLVGLGSEDGLGGGSQFWRGTQVGGSTSSSPCALTYAGSPNSDGGVGASGGDIDTAFAPVKSTAGTYRIYVASLNLGSVNVAVSNDNGVTFAATAVQGGVPADDREWIAAFGADTSLLTFHDVATGNIDVLRSDTGAPPYTQISQAIPPTDYKATNNQHGNLVIDHGHPTAGGFSAFQSFVAPSSSTGTVLNEAFLAVSNDGGHTWADKAIPCSTAFGANGLGHNFPNVSVAPNGTLYYAVSNDKNIFVAKSTDHGSTWTCSGPVSTVKQAIFPWIVATSHGEDLVYYGTNGGANETWYVYFAQSLTPSLSGFTTSRLMPVHTGQVCEGGVNCTAGRQLFDDFGVDTDPSGWAHIAFSHDSPNLGGAGTYTGYAVQQSGNPAGPPN